MTRARLVTGIAGAALCALFSACSALGLDEFERLPCDVHGEPSPCDALNAKLPADQCSKYYCKNGFGCELRPRDDDGDGHPDAKTCAAEPNLGDLDCDDGDKLRYVGGRETCDGVDNDCDGFIDEDAQPKDVAHDTSVTGGIVQVSYAAARNDTLLLALTGAEQEQFDTTLLALSDDGFSAPSALLGGNPDVCALPDKDERCNFAQLAIAATSDLLIGAGINRSHCNRGQLRVGVGPVSASLELGSPSRESNVAFGIDVDPVSWCTQSGPCPGASDPALAVLPAANGLGAQALALWLAPAGDCAQGDASRVAALGLFVEPGDAGGSLLMGTAGGHSEDLGESSDSGSPALAAFAGRTAPGGYFVAYAAGEQVELRFIPRLSDSSSFMPHVLSGSIDARHADHVALTLSAAPADAPRGLAVAFRADRADAKGGPAIVFSELAFDSDNAAHFASRASSVTLEAENAIVAGPSLAYVADGFAADEPGMRLGGWLVVWVERTTDGGSGEGRLMAARIAEAGSHLLGPPSELARGPIGEPFTYSTQDPSQPPSLYFGYVTDHTLRVSQITCHDDR